MKFEIGQSIKVNPSWWRNEHIGEILSYKYERFKYNGVLYETHRYYVRVNKNHATWYDESEIEPLDYTFDKKYEVELLDLMIDVNLAEGNFQMVKLYNEQKQNLLRGVK